MYQTNLIKKIHIGKRDLGFSDEEYEAFLFGFTGKTSSKELNHREQLLITREMGKRGAFGTKPLTTKQKACVAKWYKLRRLGVVNSKDKSALNRYSKNHIGKWNICDLTPDETNKLLGMLEGWIRKVEHAARHPQQRVIEER